MKKLLLAAGWVFIAHSAARGQISPLFEHLNFSGCTSGYFWTQTGYDGLPPDGSSYAELEHAEASSVLFNLRKADITPESTLVPDFEALREELNTIRRDEGIIPIVIADLRFQRLSETAITSGWIYAAPEGLFQQAGSGDIFVTERTLTLLVDIPRYRRGEMTFRLLPSHYLQNIGSLPQTIRLDFDDGAGWRTVLPGQLIEVDYSGLDGPRHIRLEIQRNGETRRSGTRTEAIQCISDYDDPHPAVPWYTTGNPDLPWEIRTEVDGQMVYANAYYLPSGEFDKPFIFVEGIDFDYYTSATCNGSFGWCEFTSGIDHPDYPYAMLSRMPQMLDEVRAHGYDIVLLDFRDGATWIQWNAMLLVELIRMINQAKTGDAHLIVAGASMGGQITRYALTYMEQFALEHCTRLWISLDSPHKGANVPLALQQIVLALSNHSEDAEEFLVDYLQRPAARQLLNLQHTTAANAAEVISPPVRNAWYEELEMMGFPEDCRTVAIANGSIRGTGLGLPSMHPLLNNHCDAHPLLPGYESRFFMMPSSGDPWYNDSHGFMSNSNNYVSAQAIITIKENPSVLGSILNIVGAELTRNIYTYWTAAGTPNHDYAPGGTRTSLTDFVEAINKQLRRADCAVITDYVEKHSFIPTASALAIDSSDPYADLEAMLSQDRSLCPFDAYHAPQQANERHSEISEDGLAFILAEILGGEDNLGQPLLPATLTAQNPEGAVFNYGKPGYHQIPSVHVEMGGVVKIHSTGYAHYGTAENPATMPGEFHVETLNGCNASTVVVQNMGYLQIGDEDAQRRGTLTIGKNAALKLHDGGVLRINPGSRLIIEKEGRIHISGTSILENKGEIIIRKGGVLDFNGGIFQLNGNDARLVFDGGILRVLPDVLMDITHNGTSGYLEFTARGSEDIQCEQNAAIRFRGTGPDDVIVRVTDWANVWNSNFNQGKLILENGQVRMDNNGQIWLDLELEARDVRFLDYSPLAGHATAHLWYSRGKFTNCQFQGVRLLGQDSRIFADGCGFSGPLSGVELNGGYYKIGTSSFTDCGIQSAGLTNPSAVDQCTFQRLVGFSGGNVAVDDESLSEIRIGSSTVRGAGTAVSKSGGVLRLSCNTFRENGLGIFASKGCLVSMDEQSWAGYNTFKDNGQHIELDHAGGLSMSKGYNHFAAFTDMMITGTIAGVACPDNCSSPVLDATANNWNANGLLTPPSAQFIDLYSGSFSMPCSSPPAYFFCPIVITDPAPAAPAACNAHRNPVVLRRPRKSATILATSGTMRANPLPAGQYRDGEEENPANPLIYTDTFDGVSLEDALVAAASRMEAYDSTGSDMAALDLFHEILTSGLDRTHPEVRWKMVWGRDHMKSALESLILTGEILPEQNTASFTPPVQRFVDVLNLMTDTVLTDSTYRSQFYLELDKGQLFRTLGRSDVAREIFIRLGDCRLDSLEQVVLNAWRAQCDADIAIRMQYVTEGISPDSIQAVPDATGFLTPAPHIAGTYYFGLRILSPDELEFMSCLPEEQRQALDVIPPGRDVLVYPNPADRHLRIRASGLELPAQIALIDSGGRICHEETVFSRESEDIRIEWDRALSPGIYLVRVISRDHICSHPVMIH
jgi:pimeloyl-ACP methyl ester carboxylesterase